VAQQRKNKTNIPMRERLSALYRKGEELRFNAHGVVNRSKAELEERNEALKAALRDNEPEPEDDPDAVWPTDQDDVIFITPPSPLQREMALREASAARSRFILNAKRDEESSDALSTRASVIEMEDEELIEFVLNMDEADRREEAERSVRAEEEWKEFSDLQDSMRRWAESEDPDAEEWKPLLKRDLEYGQQVEAEFKRLTEASRESLKLVAREELEERGTKKIIEMGGNVEFMSEYQLWMMHFACRDSRNNDELAFEHPNDISSLPEIASEAIADVYREFIESEKAAKNSPRAEAGSLPSVPPNAQETSESSTPEEQTESATSPGSSKLPSTTA